MPSPEQLEYALVLLRRAESDAHACRALAEDSTMADDDFPRTHDLDFLIAHANEHGVRIPDSLADVAWLSPWAAQLRYDEHAGELDRAAAVAAADAATAWAAKTITS